MNDLRFDRARPPMEGVLNLDQIVGPSHSGVRHASLVPETALLQKNTEKSGGFLMRALHAFLVSSQAFLISPRRAGWSCCASGT
jgi:hypothetical protein